ncbi:protein jagged-1-like [Patiria miniata]|uniref:Delta-like protein n=1 Tax=Patiria miniata TaxID=46514 RepID=A0A914BM48_PATMI|nr:protein jagged-1-like [Patiria miniata]
MVGACQFVSVHSSANVEFKFLRWSNPDHSDSGGGCCDSSWGNCNACDNYFIVCLDDDVPGNDDFNDCGIASIETEVISDDEFDFPSTIPNNIPNPKLIPVMSWQRQMRVKLRVQDEDFLGEELVDEDFLNIDQASSPSQSSAQWQNYRMGTHADFTFQVRIYCNTNYFTPDCSVYCIPTDNQNGHYTCDSTTGDKICQDGWEGVDCNEDIDECQTGPCLHDATCHNGMNQFSCFCTGGWTGDRCEVDVNQCAVNPCRNNGTCNDFLGFFNCSCDPAYLYLNDLCDIDYCADQPCLNGSTCIVHDSNFSCSCAMGFEGELCHVDINECAGAPCANGGNCTDGLGWFNCTCPLGYEGELCQIDINECQSSPCSNSSTCEDLVNRFHCHCPLGFEGALCLDEIDECSPNPCQNNATCSDFLGYFECNCSMGFFGDLCQVDIDYCINQTCANNGTCVDRLDGFHCLCEKGYKGAMCDVEIDECANDPCMHNGTCHDFIGFYRCSCVEGYDGDSCEQEIDECRSSPCKNDSTCIDRLDGFDCQCAAGFEGTLCDIDTDECQSFPCYDNETCIDVVNGFRCVDGKDMCEQHVCQNNATCLDDDRGTGYSCYCPPGYHGQLCQINTDECVSSPCLHDGTCEDRVNAFDCHCAPGYEGLRCENETDECTSSPCEYGRCVDLVNGFECACTVECQNGYCDAGVCRCTEGYEGEDCSVLIDYCSSSPCAKGTCVPLFDSFRCECDPFHEGEYCEKMIENPCSLSPCNGNGQCSLSADKNDGYQCTCNDDFYGEKCDKALKVYGCVVFIVGTLTDLADFETHMANLLKLLLTSEYARSSKNITVDVVKTEDYVESSTGDPLTRVTYVVWSSEDFLPKTEVEKAVDEAPPSQVNEELGYGVFKGKAEPKPQNNPNWAASHWYVIVIVILITVAVVVGLVAFRMKHTRRILHITRKSERLEMDDELQDDGHFNVLAEADYEEVGNQTANGSANASDYEIPSCVKEDMGEYAETAVDNIYSETPDVWKPSTN